MKRLLQAALLLLVSRGGFAEAPRTVDFSAEVRPLLSARCFTCHGPDDESRKAGLRLDTFEEATRPGKGGRRAVVPGRPEESELVRRVTAHDPEDVMPPPEARSPVKPAEVEMLRRWIAQGAGYTPHWAWQKPVRPALPPVRQSRWVRNGIDAFVLHRLEAAGLRPQPLADRETLARRLALDVTGLPADPVEVERFLSDRRSDAIERYVDRLLASPHYGERWARVWLDLARFADSAGYGSDPLRPNIWPYRDWVIGAFNRNLPYDRFTLEQLAGDLLPQPTEEQAVATAFHRNTMTNTEGGTEDEEWRVAAVKDRANVTAQVWMGLTLGCAQCHTHKFDPITQREYYSFYAFFDQTEDNDQPDERPTLPLYSPAEQRRRVELQGEIARLEADYRRPNPAYDEELGRWAVEAARPVPWTSLAPRSVGTGFTNGARLEVRDDRSVAASGDSAERDQYLVVLPVPAGTTALKLEALADTALPRQGPGRRDGEGNFVLNDVRLLVEPADKRTVPARYLRLQGVGGRRQLALGEAQVFSAGRNVAPQGQARQSSSTYLADAAKAIDGNPDGNVNAVHSVALTLPEENPWWELDLGGEHPVETLALWNRTDSSGGQLANVDVQLLDASRKPVWSVRLTNAPSPVVFTGPTPLRQLGLREATADHAQGGFEAGKAIDGNTSRDSGWAVGGGVGQDRALAFELVEPLPEAADLRLVLSFNFGERQTLGRFRVSATAQAAPVRILPAPVQAALAGWKGGTEGADWKVLDDHFRARSQALGPAAATIAQRRRDLEAVRGTPVPVMRELAGERRRATRVLHKGNYLAPGEAVEAGVPAAFHGWPEGAPRNRAGLAAWLTHPDNPLTARVAVNRFWAQLMGQGLVETEEDFGTQGTLPTHRELLDWLAVTFATPAKESRPGAPALGWDMKALVKLLVTSATYLQASTIAPAAQEADPLNRLYSRAARRRLDAEAVRDQALALSGLLSRRVGGASVYPWQPEGLWRAAFNGERTWATSEGEQRYRRGIYTFLRRTVPYPSMATFDAPSREQCTLRRPPTNTPLQAFVTLNDPVFVEAAQALGRRLVAEGGATVVDRLRFGLRLATGRAASPDQVEALRRLYEDELQAYQSREAEALRLATDPVGPLPPGLSAAEAAAWTTIGNVLLNLDAVLTRG